MVSEPVDMPNQTEELAAAALNQPSCDGELDELTAILESSDDAFIVKSLDNTILRWSPGAERLYGYTEAEMVGKPIQTILPADHNFEADDIIRRIRSGETLRSYETVRVGRSGRPIDVSLTVSPIRDESGAIMAALSIARDTGERKRTEHRLRRFEDNELNRVLVLEAASRVALDILASRTGREALYHIADSARMLARARYAALGVASREGSELIEFITVGMTPEEEARVGPRPRGAGVLGLLLKRTEPLRISHLGAHPASVGFPPNHPPMDSFLGVPIHRGGSVVGSLYLTDKIGGGDFTEADERAVEALGAHAAVAIHNLQMLLRQRALVSNLINAQEEERRAVAYDLHDGLTQYVMASHAHLEAFRRAQEIGKADRADRELDLAISSIKEAVIESRRLVNGLRTLALDDLGLGAALEQLIAEEKDRAGWDQAELEHNLERRRFDKTVETALYRVMQEGMTNIRIHAAAKRVRLSVVLRPLTGAPLIDIEIRDWGKGFVPDQHLNNYQHVGLQGMTERISLLGGSIEIWSEPDRGTVIRASVPATPVGIGDDKNE